MKKLLIAVIATFLLHTAKAQHNPSKVTEYKKVFKTYGFSDPNPIAQMGLIYPYYRFDGYTDKPINKEWKVVELENEFIRLMILPEIGGKIWGAWEKATGKPFLYYNQVVKFRDVAMRGAWTSGGIEANYGIMGHTPNCATPVDYRIAKKEDGSVSCFIGTLDLLTQTYWTIEINLPADKGYFTTRSFWYNSTPLEQSYYTWMNTGIKAAGNLQFIYPGNRYIGHNGEYADWHINRENGKDISFYEQNNFGGYKSYHVFGKYTDFFGAYWHDEKFGMGRYSTHDEKAGKKIWIWGLSQQGMIWDKLLTDTDGQYVEVQSGRLFNQAAAASTFTPFKHRGFAPASADTWTEYWFPVMNIKGFVKANPYGALNVRVINGYLHIDFSPLQDLKEELKVLEGDRVIYTKAVDLHTLHVFSDSIGFTGNADNLMVTLGQHKLQYRSDPEAAVLNRPVDAPKDFDLNSVYGLYMQGKENIRQRYFVQAEENLKSCLTKDPNYLPALAEMSMLMYQNMAYQESLDYALHALRIDTYDPATNFYYGMTNIALGNTIDAKDGFDIASLSVEFRGPAYTELSKIYMRENDFVNAIHYAKRSLEVNANNLDAHQLLSLVYRITNEKEKAEASLATLHTLNPLNHFIQYEAYRWMPTEATRNAFTSLIRNELPHETYLQLADWYLSLGLLNESLEVLSLAPPNPEVYYWMAYLKSKLKESDAISFIQKGNMLSAELVFPFRSKTAEILEWVIRESNDWKPKYYLGLIYWSRNNLARARTLFTLCGNPEFSPFYAARASLMKDGNYASDVKKAAELNPKEWRYGKLLVDHAIEANDYAEALAIAKQYSARFPQDFRIGMLLAKTLLLNKQYKQCSDLLNKISILPYEGATDGRLLYREAWLMQAVQQLQSKKYKAAIKSIQAAHRWPANLGVGKPYDADIDTRLENYLEGICLEGTDSPQLAMNKWNAVIDDKRSASNSNNLVTALALNKIDRKDEAEKLLSAWAAEQPENEIARWCLDVYHGKEPVNNNLAGDENFRILQALMR
ncbi:MAG: DUF5107 domain-containing protein [Cyclobacteriaceae bacterium]|nr:DUF5107 domain-containing protein [Cyclobacteriaceae bacterium]MDH4295500.1 DUF5107 domain-containing protein [Cyclobacteriaceae bacterium]MDH5250148.1 DUF5107 domain-containing protein [Cyclobacteriaceae bacterium]